MKWRERWNCIPYMLLRISYLGMFCCNILHQKIGLKSIKECLFHGKKEWIRTDFIAFNFPGQWVFREWFWPNNQSILLLFSRFFYQILLICACKPFSLVFLFGPASLFDSSFFSFVVIPPFFWSLSFRHNRLLAPNRIPPLLFLTLLAMVLLPFRPCFSIVVNVDGTSHGLCSTAGEFSTREDSANANGASFRRCRMDLTDLQV